jgi:hypothetical protein
MSRLGDGDAAEARHPRWTFDRDPDGWVATHKGGLSEVHAATLEAAEQQVARRDAAWAGVRDAAERIRTGHAAPALPSRPLSTGIRARPWVPGDLETLRRVRAALKWL